MMTFGFDNVKVAEKNYLREAKLHEGAKFIGLSYDATEDYEFFDIELETADGFYFRERTFGPNKEKVYPKDIYKSGVKIGTETKDQAFDRVTTEINTKLLYLASCFVTKDELTEKVRNVKSLKEFIEGINKAIGKPTETINFLTIWKNSPTKKKSNLIIAEKVKWCEPHVEGKKSTLQYSNWQITHNLVEEFPQGGSNNGENESTETLIIGEGSQPVGQVSDLPF